MPKTLLVGLDAACWEYLDPLLEASAMPALQSLMHSGVWGSLHSTMPPWTPTAWASIITGKNPGKHGIFDMLWRRPGSYEFTPTNARSRQGTPFWKYLNSIGVRVGLVNIPFTYPPEELDGFILCGFGTPSSVTDVAYPEEALRWVQERFDDFKPAVESEFLRSAPPEEILRVESDHQARQVEIALHLAKKFDVEVLAINLMLTDHANHKMPVIELVHEAYRRADKDLEDLIDGFGPDNILLISDHGSSRLKGDFLLNAWLRDHGYSVYIENNRIERRAALNWVLMEWIKKHLGWIGLPEKALRKTLRGLVSAIPAGWQRPIWKYLDGLIPFAGDHVRLSNQVDYKKSQVFPGSVYSGLLYLNVAGREPSGIIPSETRRELLQRLVDDLKGIPDPDTGQPLFSNAYTGEEIYSGSALGFAPDIVLDSYNTNWNIRTSKHIPHYERARGRYFVDVANRSDFGWHSRDGIFVLSGKGFKSSGEPGQAQIYDIPATLLNLHGAAQPSDYDGQVLSDLLAVEDRQREILIQAGDGDGEWEIGASLSAEESEELAEHLRALGYLD